MTNIKISDLNFIIFLIAYPNLLNAEIFSPMADDFLGPEEELNDTIENSPISSNYNNIDKILNVINLDVLRRKTYNQIDQHARKTPESAEKTLKNLAVYLTQPATNEFEKARAIYVWITHNITYNTADLHSGYFTNLSAEKVLQNQQTICEGYANLFQMLGNYAGLETRKITGYSKGYSDLLKVISSSDSNHAWNAIKIQGNWYLIDSTWGAGYVDGKNTFVRKFNEHYFLASPKEFIYTHFPENSHWQLLEKKLTFEEYTNLVYLRPAFFDNNLLLNSHYKYLIKTNDELTIILSAPDDVSLLAELEQYGKKLNKSFITIKKHGEKRYIQARLPYFGDYILRLFAKRYQDTENYKWVLDYKIETGLEQ
ncbi:transglutaminase domain-containing protein [Candidatus Venteria ishoeyi]|uniref:Transglutaminase-like superfamily protein n=1 Tax=Candidatus Venteria ishoeyi TaxID=1899563 RepID=A0A1H6F5V8_9GAMM|nr:transglutaminase domain-containing protein [Candidatus Venteria ishoeyi]MDM8546179.1 transglutaminase domain-containing protein [Candidatus Venteria ishoeyi]SEH04771.1 Transglutaminase-like superfamily protein [Candidatus Venteria ishoeyi]